MALSSRPEYELPASFLEEALSKGDECYGFLDGPVLASYGWYSHKPTATDWPGLQIHFDGSYVYMYKGFTHPAHRGQRLHAVGMTRALAEYVARGYKGIVSYVEWNNFDSLRSCYRMGYTDFGTICVAGIGNHYLLYRSTGCKPYSFRLAKSA